jgi:simple sugar transport system permease protein
MSAGRGFIALAAVIFGRWTTGGAALACLLFGAAEAGQIALQSSGARAPSALVQAIPYALTLVALVARARGRAPRALGKPYPG